MIELSDRARRVEEVTGKPIESRHAMSVVSSGFDPEAAKHTSQYLGQKSSVDALTRDVM